MQSFDLGHLEILEVLLEEQSVSKAAARLHVSPSALSRTLSKMRAATGDDLLTSAGRSLILTGRGRGLREKIKTLNDQARRLLAPKKTVDPRDIRRMFRIRASDYVTGTIGTRLVGEVARRAPSAGISFFSGGKGEIERFRRGEVDFDLGVQGDVNPELLSTPLLEDRFVCAFSRRLRTKGSRLSLAEFCARPHIIASRKAKTHVIIDDLLEKSGRSRKILATVGSFQEALLMASQSEALTAVPSKLVEALRAPLGLNSSPLPMRTPNLRISLTWHPRNKDDPEHQWLRDLIYGMMRS